MSGFLLRLRNWWQGADRTQRLVTIFGGGSLVILLIGTYIFASRPRMSLVFSNLAPQDVGAISLELENMGIPVSFDNNGNVSVPSDKVAYARANLAMKGKLPQGGSHYGSDQLKDLGMLQDPSVLKEQMKAISETELSQSMQFFDGVDSANVQITPGIDSPFEADKKPAQASVTIAEKAGSMISQDEARAMANLVASAVPGLDKSKVSIFTRTGRALWDGEEMSDSTATSNNKLDLQKAEARKRRDELQQALNRIVGPGNAIAMVDLTLDVDQPKRITQFNDPSKAPIENQSLTETMTMGSSPISGGIAGIQSNGGAAAPTIAPSGSGGAGQYSRESKQPIYGNHMTQEEVTHVGGDIKSATITVLVNTDKIQFNANDPNDPITRLANSVLPPHADTDKGFVANVVGYKFDTKAAADAKKAEDAASSSGRMQQIFSILPIAALILVAVLVLKSVGKLAGRPMAPMLAMAGGPALPMGGGSVLSAPQALQAPQKNPASGYVLPDIVKQKALEAGISEEQLQAAIEEAGEAGISVEDIPSIKSKINVPLEQLKKMSAERPEAVAMLIKSWLIEEGIRR